MARVHQPTRRKQTCITRVALVATNANRPKGSLEDGGRYWQIGANDQAKTAAEYGPIVLSFKNGAAVRVQDVAQVLGSVQSAFLGAAFEAIDADYGDLETYLQKGLGLGAAERAALAARYLQA